jgi:signal transduction histidine kinase
LHRTPAAAILGRVTPLTATILRRPLTRGCARETLYLLLGLVTGTAGFTFVVSAVSTAAGLSVVIVGLPLAVFVAHCDRWWCGLERARAGHVLGRPVPDHYAPARGDGWVARRLSVLRDRQTWLDAAWMVLSLPLGIVGFALTLAAWTSVAGLLAAPVYAWSLPGWIDAHVIPVSILAPFLAVPAAVLAAWLVRGLALVHAGVAARLLGGSRAAALAERVQTLSETRAGAVDAAVGELQRVERDLHDGAQARLVALAMDLGLAEQRLAGADPEAALAHVTAARGQARAAMAELRDLVRGIGPSILTDRGLDAALTALVAGRTPPVELHVELPGPEVGPREIAAYFVVAEALANARKHARASAISVDVRGRRDGPLRVEVVDDGIGGADPEAGTGLAGLRKRLAALDGTLTIESPRGGPTTIRAEL